MIQRSISKKLLFSSIILSFATSGFAAETTVDISGYVQQGLETVKQQKAMLNELGGRKGHDEEAGNFLGRASKAIDEAESNLKKLEEVKRLPRLITNDLTLAKNMLTTVEGLRVSGAKNFPERCLVLTLDQKGREKIKKAGLEERTGITETFGGPNTWILTVANPQVPEGVDRFHLDEKVGMIGSSDQNAALVVRSHTPQNMSVTGLVDMKTKKVMCLSKATPVNEKK